MMAGYLGLASLVLMGVMVGVRTRMLKARGVRAFVFGQTDKRDFLIPPFAFLFFYQFAAYAFGGPLLLGRWVNQLFFENEMLRWLGVGFCGLGLAGLLASLVSFGRSFRVGVDTRAPDKLVTSGIFALSRNPIYVSFGFLLTGFFLIFPSPFFLGVWLAGFGLFHRQVITEEKFLAQHYGAEYADYRKKVRRYL